MQKRNIFNSGKAIIGEVILDNDTIFVNNFKKQPVVQIQDKDIVAIFGLQMYDEKIALKLYNDYNLLICEIAAILGLFYGRVFLNMRNLEKAGEHVGRRNSSYGTKFSKERCFNIGLANKGKYTCNDGTREYQLDLNIPLPDGYSLGRLPFSEQHRQKIRQAALDGKYLSPSEVSRKGWANGKFDNVNFKHGIGGYFTSTKIGKRFFFRSLLELYFIIYYLEENTEVVTYNYEPFKIQCDNGSLYTPDFIVNDKFVFELKSKKFIYKQGGAILEKFLYKSDQTTKYCANNGLEYLVIFDEDINFNGDVFKHELVDGKYNNYSIEFLQPERVFGQRK